VCGVDAFCCDEFWDSGCVTSSQESCPEECGCVSACAGDCNGDGEVPVNELITAVNIALGNSALTACPAVDTGGDGDVGINELIQAVNSALAGC
jgi:hypothetical protein